MHHNFYINFLVSHQQTLESTVLLYSPVKKENLMLVYYQSKSEKKLREENILRNKQEKSPRRERVYTLRIVRDIIQ